MINKDEKRQFDTNRDIIIHYLDKIEHEQEITCVPLWYYAIISALNEIVNTSMYELYHKNIKD